MSLASQAGFVVYNGNGSLTDFSIPFEFFGSNTNVEVILRDTSVDPPTETAQIYSTHYTIAGTTLTMLAAPGSSKKLYIGRKMSYTQIKEFMSSGSFPVEEAEDGLDRLCAFIQQVGAESDRALKFTKSANQAGAQMESMVGKAGCLMNVNDTEDGLDYTITLDTFLADVAAVASEAATASGAASSASSSAASASTSASTASAAAIAAAASAVSAAADATGVSANAAAAVAAAAAAATSETNAASSASSASTSASAASTSASGASTSATSATNSASSATTSASAASASAVAAAASAASAAASAGAVGTLAQETPSGTINGVNTAFTLAHTPLSATSVRVYKNGVFQRQTTYYTLSTNTITFVTAPTTGDEIDVLYNY